MLKVQLPDGTIRNTTAASARSISPRKSARDWPRPRWRPRSTARSSAPTPAARPRARSSLKLLTTNDPEALAVMRHSCAHVMARAVMRLFDGVQLAFGPTIENGFYYDFEPAAQADARRTFPAIEAEMAKIVKEDEPFERLEEPRDEAVAVLPRPGPDAQGRAHRNRSGRSRRRCRSIARASSSISAAGRTFPAPARSGRSSCLSVAGAYWKGDSERQQLQRLYGTAWFSKEELEAYLNKVEEAKRRDHRVLGKQLELFTIDPWSARADSVAAEGAIRRQLEIPRGSCWNRLPAGLHAEHRPRRAVPDLGHFPYYADSQFPPLYSSAGRRAGLCSFGKASSTTTSGRARAVSDLAASCPPVRADYDMPRQDKCRSSHGWRSRSAICSSR